jgi:sortase A
LRIKDVILGVMSLALIGAGATLIVAFFLAPGAPRGSSDEPRDFNIPTLDDVQAPEIESEREVGSGGPEDKTLWLTVPKMARIFNSAIPTTEGNDEAKLKDYAAIHLQGTGFPWEGGANVYIAGHRLGYPNSDSFLAFYDLDNLEKGDQITVTDADGQVYIYRVAREFVASPTDLSVTEPVEGKDVLTLQTCTLPDYSQRLVVQAEKVV